MHEFIKIFLKSYSQFKYTIIYSTSSESLTAFSTDIKLDDNGDEGADS